MGIVVWQTRMFPVASTHVDLKEFLIHESCCLLRAFGQHLCSFESLGESASELRQGRGMRLVRMPCVVSCCNTGTAYEANTVCTHKFHLLLMCTTQLRAIAARDRTNSMLPERSGGVDRLSTAAA